jgi:hypothetical protein
MISIIYVLSVLFGKGILSPSVMFIFVIVDIMIIEGLRSYLFENLIHAND